MNSDKILRETAKVKMESSDFQQYFPTSVFRPDLKVDGLGATIYGSLNKIPVFFAGYTYWNGNYTNEGYTISIDFRTGYIFPNGAINTFVGTKIGNNIKSSELRAGVSGAFDVDGDYEFYFDVGVDKLKFPDKEIHKKFYALFEPRVLYDKFSFSIPFFIAPVSSLPKFMEDSQYTDSSFAGMGLKLTGGNLEKYNFEGGVSLCTSVNPQNISELTAFTLSASPFIKCAISNYILDFRVNVYPFVYEDPKSMVNLTLQIKVAR